MGDFPCLNYEMERSLDDADRVREGFAQFLSENGAHRDMLACLELTIYEIVVNVIEHGDIISGDGKILISGKIIDGKFSCTFTYSGSEYNIKEHKLPDLEKHFESGNKDGLGVYITRKFMDAIEYSHKDGENRLTIVKLLH